MKISVKDEMLMLVRENRKREYLELCRNFYSETTSVAQVMFSNYYKTMLKQLNNHEDAYTKYNSKARKAREIGDLELERTILESAVSNRVDTPGSYERLAIIYGKEKDNRKAFEICKIWFQSEYWKIPNMAATSLRILHRYEKLEKKLTRSLD